MYINYYLSHVRNKNVIKFVHNIIAQGKRHLLYSDDNCPSDTFYLLSKSLIVIHLCYNDK